VRSALAALLGVLLLSGCTASRDAVDSGPAENRYVAGNGNSETFAPSDRPKAPEVTGTLLDGTSFDLATLRGKVVVINYWASWCAPCRLETPELKKVHAATKADGVEFVGVNIHDVKVKALAFEKSFGIDYRSLFDPPGRIALKFRSVPPNTIPATIVIDRDGRIAAVFRKGVLREELLPVVRGIAAES
jgi:peroxiredoxin